VSGSSWSPTRQNSTPRENLRDEIRAKIFVAVVRAKVRRAILSVEGNPETVKSNASFPSIVRSL
jgi:hypothetical protein